ncbi:hypothetical protein QTG54_011064 [Skeletonema marinoi]|uniref:Uncharacterized protein n=1 Tax=Skeletonema marinoi TaxID=267567 RepID=A0AAD8Y4A0_9STRA|nr:hypothetical protein QTG54_011064 [Skeletonema marinoi]
MRRRVSIERYCAPPRHFIGVMKKAFHGTLN